MFDEKAGSQAALLTLGGAVVWAAVATIAGSRHAPMGVIELILLFATLVVAPLALELAHEVGSQANGRFSQGLRVFHPFAAIGTVAAFWVRPGVFPAALCVPWLLLGVVTALSGLATLVHKKNQPVVNVAIAVAGVDLAIAGGWLVASRAVLRPMGFQEPIILLTAVHFHYLGFATAVLAAVAVRVFEHREFESKLLRPIVWLTLFLPFVLAAGFVFSPMLRMLSAIALAVDVTALAGLLVWLSGGLVNRTARAFLRLSGTAAWLGMVLAGVYAVTDYLGRPFLTMPGMASTHGVLNGLGFVLLGTLAFLIEIEARRSEKEFHEAKDRGKEVSSIPRKRPSAVPQPTPEFVAREFYDR